MCELIVLVLRERSGKTIQVGKQCKQRLRGSQRLGICRKQGGTGLAGT